MHTRLAPHRQPTPRGGMDTRAVVFSVLLFCTLGCSRAASRKGNRIVMAQAFSIEECQKHDSYEDFWAVVDSYVLDLSAFLAHHPGTAKRIMQKRQTDGVDITRNFLDHFGHTVTTFRDACQVFDRIQQPVSFKFSEVPSVEVVIRGKVK